VNGARRPTLAGHVRARLAPAFWTGIANALPRGAVLIAGLYVAHRFGADAFARYSLAIVTVTVGGGIVSMALIAIGTKYVPELAVAAGGRQGAGFSVLLLFGATLAVALGTATFALAAPLAALLGHPDALADTLQVAAGVVAAAVLYGAVNGIVVGSARFATSAIATVGGTVVFAVGLVPLADGLGISGVLVALGVLYAVTAATELLTIAPTAAADFRRGSLAERVAPWRRIAGFLVPMLLFIAIVPALVWGCNAILANGAAPLAEVARFNAAYNWYAVAAFLPNVLAQVEFVRLSRAKSSGDGAALKSILRLAIAQNAVVMLALVGVGLAVAGPLAELFRVDDAPGRLAVRLMLVTALIVALANPTGVFFAVVDRIWLATWLLVAAGALTFAFAWALGGHGAVGMGVAFVAGFGLHAVAAVAIALRLLATSRR